MHARFKTFVANSLDPDQARYFVGPDLDPNWLKLCSGTEWFFLEKKN